MNLKNEIKSKIPAAVGYEDDTLTVLTERNSEYAVIAVYGKDEKIIDIINSRESRLKTNIDAADALKVVDIYSDEVIFIHHFLKNASPDERKADKEETIPLKEETIAERKEIMNTLSPPPLITKRRPLHKTDTSFLGLLEKFEGFEEVLPGSDTRIFDEKVMKDNNVKVNYMDISSPPWAPYLGYRDIFSEDSDLPRRLIGKTEVNEREYLTYFVLASLKRSAQPFYGNSGFVYLLPYGEEYCYWMMCVDTERGKVCYPFDEDGCVSNE